MTTKDKIARRNLSLLELASELFNVSRACKVKRVAIKRAVLLCGTCMNARGMNEDDLFDDAKRSKMDELALETLGRQGVGILKRPSYSSAVGEPMGIVLTARLNAADGRKSTAECAPTIASCMVLGLRPGRAFWRRTIKVAKLLIFTFSPAASVSTTVEIIASVIPAASWRDIATQL